MSLQRTFFEYCKKKSKKINQIWYWADTRYRGQGLCLEYTLQWLKNLAVMGDEAAINEWYNARQRPNQTIRAYASYLDKLATHLTNSPIDTDRLQTLRSSMRHSIHAVIQAQVVQPTTRADLVAQAQRIEENENLRTRNNDQSDRSDRGNDRGTHPSSSSGGPYRSQGKTKENRYDPTRGRDSRRDTRKPKEGNNGTKSNRPKLSPEEHERRKKESLCFFCGKGNHVSKDRFQRKKEESELGGHIYGSYLLTRRGSD